MTHVPVAVAGGGPAGLTAAYMLARRGVRPHVFEKHSIVGGISRTEQYKGYRYDIGGHRFYTKVAEVERFWHEILGPEFVERPRLSRIYYNSRFYNYPLNILNTLLNLGPVESARILLSYLKAHLAPKGAEETFEQWVTNRFGRRLFQTFFKTYTEKVWGIPCSEIRADWAAQRIKGLSLTVAVMNALFKVNNTKTLIEKFHYPVLGPGQMWERCQQRIEELDGAVELNTDVVRIYHEHGRVTAVRIRCGDEERVVSCDHFISSMPLSELIFKLDPPPPPAILDAARGFNYRAIIVVGLIVNQARAFPDNWIYIHSPEARVGRIQNFGNWSADLVPNTTHTSLGMEYFCDEGDDLWTMSDADLVALARREIDTLGLARADLVEDGMVIRQPKAYPVYDGTYRDHVETVREYLKGFGNLQTIGRNGMHRYNNQDHSMLTGMLAVENIFGAAHDLWEVNTERSYYEEFTREELKGRELDETAADRPDRSRAHRTVGASRRPDAVSMD
jgi:protoporphyrinogen oxidase